MMRSQGSNRRFNSREWGDAMMRRRVTPGRWPLTAASAIEIEPGEETPRQRWLQWIEMELMCCVFY